MSLVTCPSCNGTRESFVFENRGPDYRTHTSGMRPCFTCKGHGVVDEEYAERRKRGLAMRDERLARGESLYEAARRLGTTSAKLSALEHGRIASLDDDRAAIALNRPKVPEGLVEQLQTLKSDVNWNDRNCYGWFVLVRCIDFLKSLQRDDQQPSR